MTIQRSPSIKILEKLALECDRLECEPKDDRLAESADRLGPVVNALIEFDGAFNKALEKHSEKELEGYLITVLPKGHKIPPHF